MRVVLLKDGKCDAMGLSDPERRLAGSNGDLDHAGHRSRRTSRTRSQRCRSSGRPAGDLVQDVVVAASVEVSKDMRPGIRADDSVNDQPIGFLVVTNGLVGGGAKVVVDYQPGADQHIQGLLHIPNERTCVTP